MAILPPSPFVDSGIVAPLPDDAAACVGPKSNAAAADLSHSGATDCVPDEAAATPRQSDLAAAEFANIGEIFVGARKLNLPPFKLDEERFMADIEEPPLFLRQAG